MHPDHVTNRASRDTLAELHGQDAYYDTEGLIAGGSSLIDEEETALRAAVGSELTGLHVLHVRHGVAVLLLATCAGQMGCSDATDSADNVTVSDSAGVEIVVSSGSGWDEETAWRIRAEPTLEIGLAEGPAELLFSNVEDVLLLDDGRIAVADRASSQVRFFNPDGSYDGFVGGPGDGPGELGYITGLGRCGADSLFVFEIDDNNVVYAPAGEYVREARPYDDATLHRRPYRLTCSRSGHYAAIGWEPRVMGQVAGPPEIGFYRAEAPVWILTPTRYGPESVIELIAASQLAVTAELGSFLSSERIGMARGSSPHPFGRGAAMTLTPQALYIGTGEIFQIRQYGLDGRLVRLIRWPGEDLRIRPEHLAAYRTERLEAVGEDQRPALERWIAELPPVPSFPAYVDLKTDPDGNIWVGSFRKPGESARSWTVIDSAGRLLGRVTTPPGLEVTDIGSGFVAGVARDELGVERIRTHELVRPGR